MELFVDFEGFDTDDGAFIIKELAAISLTNGLDTAVLKMFKPPAEYRNDVKILETKDLWLKTHGISWDEGSVSYTNLKEVLLEMVENKQYVYVLGEKKKQWLDKVIGYPSAIIDLTMMQHFNSIFSFDSDKLCLFKEKHSKTNNYACAFEMVQKMKRWFVSCWGLNPSQEKSMQLFYQLQTLIKMHPQDIPCLDESFILVLAKKDINKVWFELPSHMRMDSRFIGFTRCTEHYNTGGDVFDGPNPFKKDCSRCNSIS